LHTAVEAEIERPSNVGMPADECGKYITLS
jgi:hypothetical protein